MILKRNKQGKPHDSPVFYFFLEAHFSLQGMERDSRSTEGSPNELNTQRLEFRKAEVIRCYMAEFQRERYYTEPKPKTKHKQKLSRNLHRCPFECSLNAKS